MSLEPVISFATAGSVIDAAALGLIALALFGAAVRRIDTAILFLALQGVLLAIASGAAALAEMEWRTWAAFAVALTVKAFVIPFILWSLLQRLAVRRETESVLPVKVAFPLAAALIPISFHAIEPFTADTLGAFDAANALPAALALLLLGLFTMVTRKKALTQVIGLVTMENGLYLAAVAATRGLPFAVEFGVAMDVLTGVAVMGLVIHEINRLLGSTNVDQLRTLRG
jgi:hydrogenase-4 component E